MTANALEEDRRRPREAGMDGFIAKPLNIETLWSVLRDVMEREKTVEKKTDHSNENV